MAFRQKTLLRATLIKDRASGYILMNLKDVMNFIYKIKIQHL